MIEKKEMTERRGVSNWGGIDCGRRRIKMTMRRSGEARLPTGHRTRPSRAIRIYVETNEVNT